MGSKRKRWTPDELDILRNNPCRDVALLAELTGHPVSSVQDRLRDENLLPLSSRWTKDERCTLEEVWGKSKSKIMKALPRFSWREITLKASAMKLGDLASVRDSVKINYILTAMNYNSKTPVKWKALGLSIRSEKISPKCTFHYVKIEDFWDFVLKNSNIVDIHRLPKDHLGPEPKEIQALRLETKPKKRRVRLTVEQRKAVSDAYYLTHKTVYDCAEEYNITPDSLRHINSKLGRTNRKRLNKTYKTVRTPSFLAKLKNLYYERHMTISQCAEELQCGKNSVNRGIQDLIALEKERMNINK